jgi:hypothetical protein
MTAPLLSIVIVNWNLKDDLRGCLASLAAQTATDFETLVVDNGSEDGSGDMVAAEFPAVTLLRETENLGFAEACNRGIAASHGEWAVMLNNDTVVDPGFVEALSSAAREAPANCGMLQTLMLYQGRPGTINSTGIELTYSGGGRDRDEGKPGDGKLVVEEIFCPTAGAAAYRRAMLDEIALPDGVFDRRHFMYYEDLDLGWRARLAGWSASFVPGAIVHHRWHGSSVRHGRSWLEAIACTNRLRTLIKNASIPFILRTTPRTALEVGKIAWHGRWAGVTRLARAIGESTAARRRVTDLTKVARRDVERTWTAPPA